MADVAAKVVLPMFKARGKPFVLVFWSRDPDGSQHNTGDSLNTVTPGINGPTSMAGIKNADDWDCRSPRFGRKRRNHTACCGNHSDATAY